MKQPNILFLFPDQHRGDWLPFTHEARQKLGFNKLDFDMPNLKKIMERGITFTNTITPSPICAPARACLASGTRYFNCGVPDNSADFPNGKKTFYNSLKDAGYEVLGVGKFDVHKGSKFWGKDGWVDQLGDLGFTSAIDNEGKMDAVIGELNFSSNKLGGKVRSFVDLDKDKERGPYINYLYHRGIADYHIADMSKRIADCRNVSITKLSQDEYCDNWITSNAIKLLENVPENKPWFMQVNFTGPHSPWDITHEMKESVKDRNFSKPLLGDNDYTATDIEIKSHYAAMLENIDRNIGLLLKLLEERNELEETIIIYSSDHGEMLGDFGLFGKTIPKKASTYIPLIISGKLIKEKGIRSALVELQDLASTILDLAHVPNNEFKESISLKRILDGDTSAHRSYQISALGKWQSISDGNFKLVCDTKRALYDLNKDVYETENLISKKPVIANELQKALHNEVRQIGHKTNLN